MSLVLNHVLENILCVDPNTSLVAKILVSEQMTTIEDFAFLEENIDSLNLNRESIKTVSRCKLKNILKWHKDSVFPRLGSEWLKLTIPQLQAYIKDAAHPRTPVAPSVVPPATQPWLYHLQL